MSLYAMYLTLLVTLIELLVRVHGSAVSIMSIISMIRLRLKGNKYEIRISSSSAPVPSNF